MMKNINRSSDYHSLALGMNEGKIGLDLVEELVNDMKRICLTSDDVGGIDEDIDINDHATPRVD